MYHFHQHTCLVQKIPFYGGIHETGGNKFLVDCLLKFRPSNQFLPMVIRGQTITQNINQ